MKKLFIVLLIVILFAAFFAAPVLAQGEAPPEPSVLEVILSAFTQLASLAGFGMAIAAVVNILKTVKVVTDTTAGKWVAGLNLIAISVLIYLKLFQPQIAIEYLDAQAAVLANILVLVLGYVVELGSSLFAHGIFADLKLPWIGKSFSRDRKAGLS